MLRVPPSRAAAQALKGRSAAPLGLRMRAGEQGHRRRSYPWGPPHRPAAGEAHSIIRVPGCLGLASFLPNLLVSTRRILPLSTQENMTDGTGDALALLQENMSQLATDQRGAC
jgi:hypothetical protein